MNTYQKIDPDDDSKILQFLMRHFAVLSFWFSSQNGNQSQSVFLSYSGCFLSIRDKWFFATAGHCINQIKEIIAAGCTIFNCTIDDFYGDLAKNQLPIPVANIESFNMGSTSIDEENIGLDAGLIELPEYYIRLLRANNIIPITENQWKNIETVDFIEEHYLIGVPNEKVSYSIEEMENHTRLKSEKIIYIIQVKKIDNPDPEKCLFPRFVGQIENLNPLSDIKGMSGGPIFGFSKKFERYYLVAIQSTWNSASLQIFGSYLQYLVLAILDYIDNQS